MYYLPYATSLRLSDLGYTNKSQSNLGITFNELHEYVAGLKRRSKRRLKTTKKSVSKKTASACKSTATFCKLKTNCMRRFVQNASPVAAKHRRMRERGGIEYIEVRSLDINPFSPIGVDEQQIRFLDLFMVWCVLADAPEMSADELLCTRTNWNRVILEGRKPGLTLGIGCETAQSRWQKWAKICSATSNA